MGLLNFFRKRLEKHEKPYSYEEEVKPDENYIKTCTCSQRENEFIMVNWCFECDAPIHINQEIEEHFNKIKDND